MEFEKFDEIRKKLCSQYPEVTEGKMMSSPAIHYNKKVFAFFSRKNKMVFKLGADVDSVSGVELVEFNPFKNKGPLTGWYEVDYGNHTVWEELTMNALEVAKKNLKILSNPQNLNRLFTKINKKPLDDH